MSNSTNLEAGIAAFNEGRYETAVEHLSKSLEEASQSSNIGDVGLSTYFLECSMAFKEDRTLDKKKVEAALNSFRQSNLYYMAAQCCEYLSTTVDVENARRLLEEAREHYKQCPNWTGEARTYRIEAGILKRSSDVSQARELLNKALKAIEVQPQGLETVKAERRQIEREILAL